MTTGNSVGANIDGELCVKGPVITKVSFHDGMGASLTPPLIGFINKVLTPSLFQCILSLQYISICTKNHL